MYQEKRRTLHIYLAEEDAFPILDAGSAREKQPRINPLGIAYCSFICTFFALLPLLAMILARTLPAYDATLSKTLVLAFSLHPTATQVPLSPLSPISRTDQATVSATGSVQEPATQALGLLTFYNGSFLSQSVPAETSFTGKDGVRVVITQRVTIPPATLTSPPTDGTASVTAYSAVFGSAGNIAPSDIQYACCGGEMLVQNLDAFSGGKNAQKVTVVMQSDITSTTTPLRNNLHQEAADQALREMPPGQQLLSLACTVGAKANHQAGDQAQQVQITVSERCIPLAYAVLSVQQQAMVMIHPFLPHTYTIERALVIVLTATLTDETRGLGTATVHITAFLREIHPQRRSGA